MVQKPLLAMLAFALAAMALPAAAQPVLPNMSGSWQFSLMPNGSSNSIAALGTFTTDGSVVETDESNLAPLSFGTGRTLYSSTTGHGIWQPGPAISRLYIQITSLVSKRAGAYSGKRVLTITGGLDSTGNNFSGAYTVQFTETNGQTQTATGNVTGQKMVHPLLP